MTNGDNRIEQKHSTKALLPRDVVVNRPKSILSMCATKSVSCWNTRNPSGRRRERDSSARRFNEAVINLPLENECSVREQHQV